MSRQRAPKEPVEAVDPVFPEGEERPTKVIPIPPDQVIDNVEGEMAENGEIIRSTTQEVDAVTEVPVSDPNILRDTSEGADENAPALVPDETADDHLRVNRPNPPDGFGPLGSPERARAVREERARRPDEEGYGRPRTTLRPEDATGGETTEELQVKANSPIENSGIPSAIVPPPGRGEQLQVGQQVDLATANRVAQRQTAAMNEDFSNRGLTADEMRQQRRRSKSVV